VLPIPIALWIERWDVLALGVILTLFITAWIDSLYQRMMLPGFKRAGDFAFWPFLSKSNYVAALAKPPYLCGFDRRS
jgi:hypothetical protein